MVDKPVKDPYQRSQFRYCIGTPESPHAETLVWWKENTYAPKQVYGREMSQCPKCGEILTR